MDENPDEKSDNVDPPADPKPTNEQESEIQENAIKNVTVNDTNNPNPLNITVSNNQSTNSDHSEIVVIKSRKRKRKHNVNHEGTRKRRKTVKIILSGSDDNVSDDNRYSAICDAVTEVLQNTIGNKEMKMESDDFGDNYYKPKAKKKTIQKGSLRPIFIDGSNVAYAHGQNKYFSVKGLQICIDYFRRRGHEVKAFVPNFRLRKNQSSDQKLLQKLERLGLVVVTPTLIIQQRRRIPYDDWYIVQAAAIENGIIVSRDNFEDIVKINPSLRRVVEERRLIPTFVNDTVMFPVDPLGNRQNNLKQFLRF